jgi:hypothetical protein
VYVISRSKAVSEQRNVKYAEGSGRGLIFGKYLRICQEGLRKDKKNLVQDSRCPSRDLNREYPEYNSEGLSLCVCKIVFLGI